MITIHIYSVGKNKSSWLVELINIYTQRLSSKYKIEWHLYKKEASLYQNILPLKTWVYLTEKAPCTDSITFAKKFRSWIDTSGGQLHFVIGPDMGLDPQIAKKATHKLSLSPMTLTHQMVRAFFLEQLYRADQIFAGTPYHK
ncbi:50S rRNA methyltransferase [Candidatus Aerophobetes bacterium]|uniref:Ribosomal RNA large subunit methyltransferase H n=1 Tax=Aerophobetes bacterium TaxID=2030807 RepID=A0A2A4X7X3_UNCAE|nr:MAG: 50S rRNA methyltransferase [Candidatus Aerophobetes bacterium]